MAGPFEYALCSNLAPSDSGRKSQEGLVQTILLHYVYFMGRNKIVETEEQIRERKRLAVMLRVLRATLGLSQRDLSLITGLSFSAVAKLEYGDIRLNPEKLRDLLAVFDAAGVEYSSDDEAISVRIGSQVLERLYLRHGLSWAVDESIS